MNFELKLAVGLSDIHSLLKQLPDESGASSKDGKSDEDNIDWFKPQEKERLINSPVYMVRELPDFQLEAMDSPIIGETIYATGIQGSDNSTLPAWVKASINDASEPFSCMTDNESACGYCILWPGPNTPKIRVGEVLGIHLSANEGNSFRIGVSRWIRNIPGQSLQVGLEIIGLSSEAASIRKEGTAKTNEFSTKCILLPEDPSTGKLPTLLTPVLPFGTGDNLILIKNNCETTIRLTRLMESTGAFCQFQFKSMKERTPEESLDKQQLETNFDSIWNTI